MAAVSDLPFVPPEAEDTQLGSMTREAYQRLRDKIIRLELAPGAVINDAILMDELNLGRTPIREAMQRLACEGLVVVRPRRGAFVSSLSLTDLQQIFELRQVIESYAAALAAERATATDLALLAKSIEQLDQTPPDAPTPHYVDIDRAFHRAVARASHNRYLEYTLSRMYNLNLRLWYLALDKIGPMRDAIEEHRNILAAIQQHDGPAAQAAMQAHITAFQARIKDTL